MIRPPSHYTKTYSVRREFCVLLFLVTLLGGCSKPKPGQVYESKLNEDPRSRVTVEAIDDCFDLAYLRYRGRKVEKVSPYGAEYGTVEDYEREPLDPRGGFDGVCVVVRTRYQQEWYDVTLYNLKYFNRSFRKVD